mmetsp:Transcript_26205/g.51453  ORF Transcript_26205/g.51453 Transcript_26205/m.51453 type:complete len:243 (+) Transcript_26205:289-1017(+)
MRTTDGSPTKLTSVETAPPATCLQFTIVECWNRPRIFDGSSSPSGSPPSPPRRGEPLFGLATWTATFKEESEKRITRSRATKSFAGASEKGGENVTSHCGLSPNRGESQAPPALFEFQKPSLEFVYRRVLSTGCRVNGVVAQTRTERPISSIDNCLAQRSCASPPLICPLLSFPPEEVFLCPSPSGLFERYTEGTSVNVFMPPTPLEFFGGILNLRVSVTFGVLVNTAELCRRFLPASITLW